MKEALQSKEKFEWIKSLELEYRQYCEANMFKECELSQQRNEISTRMLMNRKADGRFRPRHVARGFEQKYGIDYKEVFAPVANYGTFRLGIAIAAHYGFTVRTFDVTAAFAQSKMEEELYIKLPEGYEEFGRKYMKKEDTLLKITNRTVLKLRTTLQGVKQGARNWYSEFSSKMESLGLTVSIHEPCLFFKITDSYVIILILWVDDYMWVAPNSEEANDILNKVNSAYKTRETHGVLLGMNITNRKDGIFISSRDYIERKCLEFGINANSIPCQQPMDVNLQLLKSDTCSSDPFLEIIGSLIHAVNTTRIDVAFPVGVLARFGNCYNEKHQDAAVRVLRYLYTTKDKGIYFKNGMDAKRKPKIDLFCDADFAGDSNSGKSTTGVIITFNGSGVLWSSKLQSCVTKNTMQAELVATNTGVDKLITIKNILDELGWNLKSVPVYQDNAACRRILEQKELKSTTRHMVAKYFFLKEQIENGIINMKEIETKEQPADMMTKSLNRKKLVYLSKLISLVEQNDLPNGGSVEVTS